MRRIIAAIMTALLTFGTASALAEEAPALTPKVVIVEKKTGVWFPEDQSERILLRLETADKMEGLIDAQDALIAEQKNTIRTATIALDVARQLNAQTASMAADFKSLAVTAIAEKDSLARSPALWAGIGAGAVIVIIGVIKLLSPSVITR